MNPATFIQTPCNMEASITLEGETSVAGTVTYSDRTATFTPSVNLLPGTTYTATVTERVKNLAGIPLSGKYVWRFTTADETCENATHNEGDQTIKGKI